MNLWRKGHGAPRDETPARRAAVSPQIFPIYDKAGFLHTQAVESTNVTPRLGFGSGRGQREI